MSDELPTAERSERALLGGLILRPDGLGAIAAIVQPEDFWDRRHQALFSLLKKRVSEGLPIDQIALPEAVALEGHHDRYGGIAYIVGLVDDIPSTVNMDHYARVIRDCSLKRRTYAKLGDLQARALEVEDPNVFVESAVKEIGELRCDTKDDSGDLGEAIDAELTRKELQAAGKIAPCVSSGLNDLDDVVRLVKSTAVVVAARPSMGKSALSLNIAMSVAMDGGSVGMFSLEMDKTMCVDRLLAAYTGVSLTDIQQPHGWSTTTWEKVTQAHEELAKLDFRLDCRSRMTVDMIRARALQWRIRSGDRMDMIVVDYLGLMPTRPGYKTEDTGANMSGLKALAKDLECVVIVVHQLNRAVEKRDDKIPMMSDLRDSGEIEQHADTIMLVHRPHYYDDAAPHRLANLYIAKQRQGRTGVVELEWWGDVQRFCDPRNTPGRPDPYVEPGRPRYPDP